MFKILISDSLNDEATKILENNNLIVDIKINLELSELKKIIPNYDGLIVRSATKVTKEIIDEANNLKIIGRAGSGVDNIDVNYAKSKKIITINTPGGNTNATAEHTFALLFSVYRNIGEANASTHKGLWEKKKFKGFELREKKIGLIGFGNVSSRVAEIANNLNMKVFTFSNSFSSKKSNFPYVKQLDLNSLISSCDIISFHCKPQSDGKTIINESHFKKMKKNLVIINTARGNLIDELSLKNALNNNLIYGAGIDVFSSEPAKNNILFGTKNLILTPHIAASTHEAQINVAIQVAREMSEFFKSGKVKNSV